MGLDINTPKGQSTLQQELDAVGIYRHHHPETRYIRTPKDGPATVDALLLRGDDLIGVVETKCREMSLIELAQFNNEWLVTWEKVDASRRIATALGVPLYGFLYLVPDQTLFVVSIADETGLLRVPIKIEATLTQRTVNGGEIVRNNAYINVLGAEELRLP